MRKKKKNNRTRVQSLPDFLGSSAYVYTPARAHTCISIPLPVPAEASAPPTTTSSWSCGGHGGNEFRIRV